MNMSAAGGGGTALCLHYRVLRVGGAVFATSLLFVAPRTLTSLPDQYIFLSISCHLRLPNYFSIFVGKFLLSGGKLEHFYTKRT
jgi:hypothetical protein